MARFDIYKNPGKSAQAVPYLLDVQSDYVSGLPTRLVIPLRERNSLQVLPLDLCPIFTIKGQEYFLATAELGAIPAKLLQSRIGNADERAFEISTALDRIFGHP
jgi:toxin CcdB